MAIVLPAECSTGWWNAVAKIMDAKMKGHACNGSMTSDVNAKMVTLGTNVTLRVSFFETKERNNYWRNGMIYSSLLYISLKVIDGYKSRDHQAYPWSERNSLRNLIIDVVWSLTPCLLGETKNKKSPIIIYGGSVAGFVPGSHWFSSFFLIQSQLDSLILLEVILTVCFISPEKPPRGIGQSSKLSHLRADNSHILPF